MFLSSFAHFYKKTPQKFLGDTMYRYSVYTLTWGSFHPIINSFIMVSSCSYSTKKPS